MNENIFQLRSLLLEEKQLRSRLKQIQQNVSTIYDRFEIPLKNDRYDTKLKWASKSTLPKFRFEPVLRDNRQLLPESFTWNDLISNDTQVIRVDFNNVNLWDMEETRKLISLNNGEYVPVWMLCCLRGQYFKLSFTPHGVYTSDFRPQFLKLHEETIDDVIVRFHQHWAARKIQKFVRDTWFWVPRYRSGRPGLQCRKGFLSCQKFDWKQLIIDSFYKTCIVLVYLLSQVTSHHQTHPTWISKLLLNQPLFPTWKSVN